MCCCKSLKFTELIHVLITFYELFLEILGKSEKYLKYITNYI